MKMLLSHHFLQERRNTGWCFICFFPQPFLGKTIPKDSCFWKNFKPPTRRCLALLHFANFHLCCRASSRVPERSMAACCLRNHWRMGSVGWVRSTLWFCVRSEIINSKVMARLLQGWEARGPSGDFAERNDSCQRPRRPISFRFLVQDVAVWQLCLNMSRAGKDINPQHPTTIRRHTLRGYRTFKILPTTSTFLSPTAKLYHTVSSQR